MQRRKAEKQLNAAVAAATPHVQIAHRIHYRLSPLPCLASGLRTCSMFGVNPSCAWGAWPCPRRRRCRARVWNSGYGWGRDSGRLPPCCSSPSPATSGRRTKGAVFFSDLNSFSSVLSTFRPCPGLTFSSPGRVPALSSQCLFTPQSVVPLITLPVLFPFFWTILRVNLFFLRHQRLYFPFAMLILHFIPRLILKQDSYSYCPLRLRLNFHPAAL